MRGRAVKLKFRKPEAGQRLKDSPEVVLETGVHSPLKELFQEYARLQTQKNTQKKKQDADPDGEDWEEYRFMALGQPVYLSPDQSPREACLLNGHIIRVSDARRSKGSSASAAPKKPEQENKKQGKNGGEETMLSAEEYKDRGNSCFKNGQYIEAAVWYTKGLQADKKSHVLYSNRSAAYLGLIKRVEKEELLEMLRFRALRDALRCNTLKGNWPRSFQRMSGALESLGFFDQALVQINTAVILEPSNSEYRQKRDELQMKRTGELVLDDIYRKDPIISKVKETQQEEASHSELQMEVFWLEQLQSYRYYWDEAWNAAASRGSGVAKTHKEEGNSHYKGKEYLKAARSYTQAIRADPLDAVLHSNRGAAYLEEAKLTTDGKLRTTFLLKAFRDLTFCTEARCKWDKAFNRLGSVTKELGFPKVAWVFFSEAVKLNPGNKDAAQKLSAYKSKPIPSEIYSRQYREDKGINEHREIGRSMPTPADITQELLWLQGILNAGEESALEPFGGTVCSVVEQGSTKVLKWASGVREGERHRWLRECFRLREGMDHWGGVNCRMHREDCSRVGALAFLVFCSLLEDKEAVPYDWDWTRFLASLIEERKPLVFQKLNPSLAVSAYSSSVVGVGAQPAPSSMVAVASFIYQSRAGHPWPNWVQSMKESFEEGFLDWLKDNDASVFDGIGGESWEDLLEVEGHEIACDCEDLWREDLEMRIEREQGQYVL